MFLLMSRVSYSCFEVAMIWCFNQGPVFGYTNDPSEATYIISLTIFSWKNGYPCERDYNDRSSSRGARHDIILPKYQRTNIITTGKLSQPSYLTGIQIRLVSWYPRLRMFEKKRCNSNRRNDIVRFSGNELWERVPETIVHHYTKERMRRWLMGSAAIHRKFQTEGFQQ